MPRYSLVRAPGRIRANAKVESRNQKFAKDAAEAGEGGRNKTETEGNG